MGDDYMKSYDYENGNEPYITEEKGIVTGVGESFSSLTEYPIEEFLHKTIAQIACIIKMGP